MTQDRNEDQPIPFPGDDVAVRFDGGGWSLDREATAVDWPNSDSHLAEKAFCGEAGTHGWVCSRPKRHKSVWHVAEVDYGKAVACWRTGDDRAAVEE